MLGYLGEPIALSAVLDEPPHSLQRQSYAARELAESVVCADGWGAGFYLAGDPSPCLYRSTLPIWADVNRPHLGRAIHSSCMLACVRSATDSLSVSPANTPPFSMGPLLFVHNGYIENFSIKLRRELDKTLPDQQYAAVRGNTDSEYVLAAVAAEYERDDRKSAASRLFGAVCAATRELLLLAARAESTALLTLIVSDGQTVVGSRSAVGKAAPSLYVLPGPSRLAAGTFVASEPLDPELGWQPIPENSAVIIHADGTCESRVLDRA